MSNLRKFAALSFQDQQLYVTTACYLLLTKACLILLPFEWVYGLIGRIGTLRRGQTTLPEMYSIVRSIERLSPNLAHFRITCLPQALVGYLLLRRKGFDVQLKIGVRKLFPDALIAHAWLEYENQVVLGRIDNLGEFVALPALRAARK